MKRKLLLLLIMLSLGYWGWGQTYYYSAGNDTINLISSWWSNTNGSGSHPSDFVTSNQIFIIQNGNSMVANSIWTVSGTNSKVIIQSGGQINANGYDHKIKLELQDGGSYIILSPYSSLTLTATSNSNFQLNSANFRPTLTYGNLILNYSGNINAATSNMNILGNLQINNGAELRGTTSGTPTHSIGGDIIINSGGVLTLTNGSGAPIFDIAGNITNLGIINALTSNGLSVINFKGSDHKTVAWGIKTGNKHAINIASTKTISFVDNLTIDVGTLTVNGILDCGATVIGGTGEFNLASEATMKTANASGIDGLITVSGTKTFNPAANYEFNGSSEQVTGALLPTTINNLTIDNAAGVKLSNSALTVSGNLTINSGKLFTIESGKQVSVSGALTNNGTLTLQSPGDNGAPGSLITNGTVSGNVVAERYIAAYTTTTDGWHLVSSPVNGAVIGNFSPGTNDDFYKYSETENLWKNWKASSFDFTNGEGYLCSYQSAATKSFTGVPNNADVSFSDMSLTSTRGWHLLGNPFPCAIKWNDGNWTLTNINTTAKVLNSGGSYTDITANGIIPAMQGFFVEVTNSTNSITIPKAARVHDAMAWYKDVQANRLVLTAQSDNNNTYTETVVRFDPEATTGFDEMFDSHFLSGIYGAPQFYSIVGNEKLSSNVFPVSGEASTIPLGFVKGNADSYTLSASGIETFVNGQSVILEDLKTGIQQKLNDNPVYSFTSATGDDANRFQLKFGAASGINEPSANPFSIYAGNGIVYVNNSDNQTLKGTITVYSVTGQAITTRSLTGDRLQKLSFNSKPGCYIVRVTTDKGVYSQKIIL